jgi:hypothetical protein
VRGGVIFPRRFGPPLTLSPLPMPKKAWGEGIATPA